MALRPGAREPSVGSTCSDLFIALWNATRSVLQRPWWAVGACSRSSSHSVHVVVVVEAHEQDDAEKFASCLLIMCTRAPPMFWQPDHECPSVSSLSGLKLVDVFLRRNEQVYVHRVFWW